MNDAVDAPMAAQAQTQLAISLGNAPTASNTIYITDDPAVNKLSLSITSTADATFTKATPVEKSKAPQASGSLLYLNLTPLQLTAQEFGALQVSAPAGGWAFLADAATQTICLAPTADFTQTATSPAITIEIDKLTLTNPPSGASVQLYLTLFRIGGVTMGNVGFPWGFKSLLQQAPTGKADLHPVIALTVPQIEVVTATGDYAGYKNSLSFVLGPGDKPHTITADSKTTFSLTFVYADADDPYGYGDLCTAAQAIKGTSLKAGQGAQGWHITPPQDAQNPAWTLKPTDGAPILGGTGSVEFLFSGLVTELVPGPTLMFLSYSGVPGYEDGAYVRVLEKVGHAVIDSFEITPNPSHLTDGNSRVNLTWKTKHGQVSVSGYGPVTGTSLPRDIGTTTPFTLEVDGKPANSGNSAIQTKSATVLPIINSFDAAPAAIYQKDFPHTVALSWNVNTNDPVTLESSVGGGDKTQYDPVASVGLPIDQPQMMTLVPTSGSDDPLVRRNVVISAFQPQLARPPVSPAPTFVAASPAAPFVVVASSSQSSVTPLDTLAYQPIAGSVQVGQGPAGIAFAPDGRAMYVACNGGNVVSPIGVTAANTSPPYTFSSLGDVAVAGGPRGIAVSPDGKYVYVTTDDGHLVVLAVQSNGSLTELTSIVVGSKPVGVGVLPTGVRVYVANSGDSTVSVIGVSKKGVHSLTGTIQNLPSGPSSVVVTPNCKLLLVACKGADSVVAVNVEYPYTAPTQSLTVGSAPAHLALVPGSAYALVANSGSSSLSLLSFGSTPQSCRVLEQSIQSGAAPQAVAVTPEAGVALAATSGEATLSVLTLAEYVQQPTPVKVGAQATDVAVAPDGTQVVTWHNASTTFRGTPSTGVCVLDMESQEPTPQLANQEILAFAFDRSAAAQRAFALTKGNAYVEIVNTSSWAPAGGFDLSSMTKGAPRNLAASADGSTLFALAGDASHRYDVMALAVASDGSLSAINGIQAFTTTVNTITALAAAPDASAVYALDSVDSKLWRLTRGSGGHYELAPNPIAVPAGTLALAMAPDGSELFLASRPGLYFTLSSVALPALTSHTVTLTSVSNSLLNGLAVSPDGAKLFGTDAVTAGVRVFDTASLRLIQTIPGAGNVSGPMGVAVTPDGSQVFTANVYSGNLGVLQQVQPASPGAPTTQGDD